MILSRALLQTPIGDMLALDSDEGLCALEFIGPANRLARLETRLGRWFPPHDIADRETPTIAWTRAWLQRTSPARLPMSAPLRSTCGAPRSSDGCGRRCVRFLRAKRRAMVRSRKPRVGRGVAGRGRRQRRQPHRDHRSLPQSDRVIGIARRLRRGPRSEDLASRPRAPLAVASRSLHCSDELECLRLFSIRHRF